MQTTYQIQTGPDGIHWVSVEPLMEDTKNALHALMDIDPSALKKEDQDFLNIKIAMCRGVYEFLGSLLTEQTLKDIKAKSNAKTN
jgi:hypothetical protein